MTSARKHKRCSTCKQTKHQNVCKPCKAAHTRNWKHAMATGIFDALREAQEGRCSICGVLSETLLIDHCHKTGKLRGLLCRKCNTVIGMCDDSVLILNSAIRYVQEWVATHAAPANASPETEE